MPRCFRTIKENEHRKETEANDDISEHECTPKRQHNGENANRRVLTGASGRCYMGVPGDCCMGTRRSEGQDCEGQIVKLVDVKWLRSGGQGQMGRIIRVLNVKWSRWFGWSRWSRLSRAKVVRMVKAVVVKRSRRSRLGSQGGKGQVVRVKC